MSELYKSKLLPLIKAANTILVTSHHNPDPDAICSTLFTYKILKENFPGKRIYSNIEDNSLYFDFISSTKEITNTDLTLKIEETRPDLIVMLDGPALERAVKDENANTILSAVDHNIKYVIIDHHVHTIGLANAAEMIINDNLSSACEQAFMTFIKDLGLKKFAGYGEILMTGILRDTMWFRFLTNNFANTFKVATELITDGADIETITQNITRYSHDDILILKEYLKNITIDNGFTYSYLSDEFYDTTLLNQVEPGLIARAGREFNDNFLVKIESNKWGFSVKKSTSETNNKYSVAFRGVKGVINVAVFAMKFSGGGHKGAAGGIITATSPEHAIEQVKKVIHENLNEALSTA